MRSLLLALAATLALAAPAAAAAPWSAPQNVSSVHEFVDSPALGFAADGTGLATWVARDGVGPSAAASVDGAVLGGPQHTISRSSVVSPPVHYAATRTLVVTQRALSDERVRLSAVYGRADGVFGLPRTIAVRSNLRLPQLVANAGGAAAVAWFEDRGVRDDRVYLSYRSPGGDFGRPVLIATDRVRSVSVAISARGDLLVAWNTRGGVRARLERAGTSRFGAVDTIRSDPADSAALRTAVAGNGRAYVAWGAQLLTEGGDRGPVYYEAAVRPAGAARFRAAQRLERQPATEAQSGLDLVVDSTSRATVAWTGWDGARYRVRTAVTGANAVFGAGRDVSPAGEDDVESALAGAPDGRVLVVWTRVLSDAPAGAIGAALAASGGPFGPPEVVTDGPEARVPAAAFDARDNRFAVVWSNRPAGGTATVLQSSTR